jgi:hypothetical protein
MVHDAHFDTRSDKVQSVKQFSELGTIKQAPSSLSVLKFAFSIPIEVQGSVAI